MHTFGIKATFNLTFPVVNRSTGDGNLIFYLCGSFAATSKKACHLHRAYGAFTHKNNESDGFYGQ